MAVTVSVCECALHCGMWVRCIVKRNLQIHLNYTYADVLGAVADTLEWIQILAVQLVAHSDDWLLPPRPADFCLCFHWQRAQRMMKTCGMPRKIMCGRANGLRVTGHGQRTTDRGQLATGYTADWDRQATWPVGQYAASSICYTNREYLRYLKRCAVQKKRKLLNLRLS